jgi:hypothetical protein
MLATIFSHNHTKGYTPLLEYVLLLWTRKHSNKMSLLYPTQGGEKEKSKISAVSGPLHPALRRAAVVIEPLFEEMLEEQV